LLLQSIQATDGLAWSLGDRGGCGRRGCRPAPLLSSRFGAEVLPHNALDVGQILPDPFGDSLLVGVVLQPLSEYVVVAARFEPGPVLLEQLAEVATDVLALAVLRGGTSFGGVGSCCLVLCHALSS